MVRIRSPVLIGRSRELSLLVEWLAEASTGGPRLVVIGGEAGIGKTRLVTEFARLAAEQGARVLLGAAADYGAGGLPFGAIAEAFRPVGFAEVVKTGQLTEGAAESGEPVDRASDLHPQLRLFESLLAQVERLAADRPLLLALDDMHWADSSTREFLAFLGRNLGSTRLLVLATYRSDDVGRDHPLRRYLTELGRGERVERLTIERLGRAEVREQLRAISGDDPDERLVDRLFARAQGNPFFSEELLASAGADEPDAVPATLREMLLARVEKLASETRAVLAALAVAGVGDELLLAEVTDMPEAAVTAALRDAIDSQVVEPSAGGEGYGFRHALVREAVYADLLGSQRARLHLRIAQALTGDDAAPTAQLLARVAFHWQRAGRPREAFVASWRAAEAAERAHAYAEAAQQYESVLTLWDAVDDPSQLVRLELSAPRAEPARVGRGMVARADPAVHEAADQSEVVTRAGRAAYIAGDVRRGMRHLQDALAGIDATEVDRLATVYLSLVPACADAGDGAAARAAIDGAVALIDRCSPALRIELLIGLVGPLIVYDIDEAVRLGQLATAAADATGDADTRMRAYSAAGRAIAIRGQVDAGLALLDAARAIAGAGSSWLADIEKDRATVLQIAARFEEALAGFEASQAAARPFGVQLTIRHNDAEVGQILYRLGRWTEAEPALERALRPPAAEWGRPLRGQLLVGQGRFDEAHRELGRARATVASSGSSASIGPYHAALAEMSIWEGRPEEARQVVTSGLRSIGFDLRWLGDLTLLGLRAAADAGEHGRRWAEQLNDDLTAASSAPLAEGSVFERETRAALLSAEAELGRARGAPDDAAWAAAAAAWHELHEPYPEAYALYRRAEALLYGQDGRAAAADPLRDAWQLVSAMGAAPLLALVEDLARRARLPVGQGAPAAAGIDAYALTAREREVLALLARGYPDRRIAEALFISAKTASVHVSNVKAKLGVEHRAEAAAIGLRLGLAEDG